MSEITLLVNNMIYGGWQGASVRRSMDYFASSFSLELTDNQAGQARTIKLGSPCQLRVDDELIITGFIDRIAPGYDRGRRSLTVAGRSKVADLVDCSLPPDDYGGGQKTGQTLLQLAGAIAGRFGIQVRSEVHDLEPIKQSVLSPEQTPFEFLETHARAAGVRLLDDPDGNIVIVRASTKRLTTKLVLGENIEAAEGEFSNRDMFSHYHVLGQADGFFDNSADAAHIFGFAGNGSLRYRPTTIIASGVMDCLAQAERLAEWERNVKYGRSRQAVYTVSGWHHADGLWQPNRLVLVVDKWMGLLNEWLMIGSVEMVINDSGKKTMLTLMPPEAYDLAPLPQKDEGVW